MAVPHASLKGRCPRSASSPALLVHSRHSVQGLLQVEGSQPGVNVKCSQTLHTHVLLSAVTFRQLLLVSSEQHGVNTLQCFIPHVIWSDPI